MRSRRPDGSGGSRPGRCRPRGRRIRCRPGSAGPSGRSPPRLPPVVPAASRPAPGAPAVALRQCSRCIRAESVAPRPRGMSTTPASASPSMRTRRPPRSWRAWIRACGNAAPSSCSLPTARSIPLSAGPSAPAAPVASVVPSPANRPTHSIASSAGVRPAMRIPDAGGAVSTRSLPRTASTPVRPPRLRARSATRSPRTTSISLSPIGSARSMRAGRRSAAGLPSGAGSRSRVPTRSERSCRRPPAPSLPAFAGRPSASVQSERPSRRAPSHASSGARAASSEEARLASSSASKAMSRPCTCRSPARSESRPGCPSRRTRRPSAAKPSWS